MKTEISDMSTCIMKSTKVQNPRRNKCSAVVELETNCLVAEYRKFQFSHRFKMGKMTIALPTSEC